MALCDYIILACSVVSTIDIKSTHLLTNYLELIFMFWQFGGLMHGLIFMTWEKYLAERLGSDFLRSYREKIGESPSEAPIATRIYDDAILLAGVGAASELSKMPVEMLVHEYGQYFITNGLTGHLCSYILSSVHSGRDLLLTMRDAHSRLRRTMEELQPPLFEYGNTNNPKMKMLHIVNPA